MKSSWLRAQWVRCECGCGEYFPAGMCVRRRTGVAERPEEVLSAACAVEVYGEEILGSLRRVRRIPGR